MAATTDLNPLLIASLGGEDTLDGFYFLCAFASFDYIHVLLKQHNYIQGHLNFGLKAAYLRQRTDVARLLLEFGADAAPLIATIGPVGAQKFLSINHDSPRYDNFTVPAPTENPERQRNELRLSWARLKPHSRTLLTLVEGVEGASPTVCHLQAYDTKLSPAERIAWMEFDLAQSSNAHHLDRIADVRNIDGTPLHWAVDDHVEVWKNVEVLEFMIEKGADPMVKNRAGLTPREVCVEMLELAEGVLIQEMRKFYEVAEEVLERAEKDWRRKHPHAKGLIAKARVMLGWQ